MTTHIDALSALIDDLFELSRLEAGDIGWTIERVPLRELVAETVEAMRVQAEAKGVAVAAEVPERCAPRANPEKLQRVLFNLIQNAIRHTPADGSVVVRAEPVDTGIEVEVADTGAGSPRRARARVHRVLSWRQRCGANEPGRRTGAGGIARDRRGARRPDLAGGCADRDARPVQLAGRDLAPARGQDSSAHALRAPRPRPPPREGSLTRRGLSA